jgi:hypothetical protein
MRKKLNRKLALSKETLRTLSLGEVYIVKGAQTGTGCSNPTDTCESCIHCPSDLCTRVAQCTQNCCTQLETGCP